jgi:hypothetical protein
MAGDKKITILTIKNTLKKMDLLRVHIYEHSIRFDSKVENAIKKYPELNDDVVEINNLWKKSEINEKQVLMLVLHLIGKDGDYLEKFYFTEEELDVYNKSLMLEEHETIKFNDKQIHCTELLLEKYEKQFQPGLSEFINGLV